MGVKIVRDDDILRTYSHVPRKDRNTIFAGGMGSSTQSPLSSLMSVGSSSFDLWGGGS